MRTVSLLSGGVDSIALLWKLLNETDDEVLVQHIRMQNYYNRWEAEEQATNKAIDFMRRECRSFTVLPVVTQTTTSLKMIGMTYIFFGVIAAIQNGADRLGYGRIKSDTLDSRKLTRVQNLRFFDSLVQGHQISAYMPLDQINKKEVINLVPKELVDISFTCRIPIKLPNGQFETCGKCLHCLRFLEGIEGKDPAHPEDLNLDSADNLPFRSRSWDSDIKSELEKVNSNRTDTAIFMLSGGINSVARLWQMLKETDKEIAVQHVSLKTLGHPWQKEKRASDSALEYMQANCRSFRILSPIVLGVQKYWDHRSKMYAILTYASGLLYHTRASFLEVGYIDPNLYLNCRDLIDATTGRPWYPSPNQKNWPEILPEELLKIVY